MDRNKKSWSGGIVAGISAIGGITAFLLGEYLLGGIATVIFLIAVIFFVIPNVNNNKTDY